MPRKPRPSPRFRSEALESLETKTLMSVLINAKPTAEVVPDSPWVRVGHGRVVILQPTPITIVGTAQPPSNNIGSVIEVFGLDADGNVLNGNQPLTTTTTNFLGRYNATFELPTTMRATVNSIIVRQRATGFLDGSQTIDATTLAGLTGDLAINGTTLENLQGDLAIEPGTISNLQGDLAIEPGTISNLQGDLAINGFESDFEGEIAETEGLTGEIFGTLEIDIDLVGVGVGEFKSDGPVELTIFATDVSGTVTTPDLSGSLSGGTGDESGRTGTLSDGTGDESGRTGTLSDGTGTILPTTGTFTQTGEAIIAATTGTIRLDVDEFAVSDPITIFVHQSRRETRPDRLQPLARVSRPETPRLARLATPGQRWSPAEAPRPHQQQIARHRLAVGLQSGVDQPVTANRLPMLPSRPNLRVPARLD